MTFSMNETRPVNPVLAEVHRMDLHLSVVGKPDAQGKVIPGSKVVMVALQPRDALISEAKVGAMITSWPDLLLVIKGLLDQGTEAFGPMPPFKNKP